MTLMTSAQAQAFLDGYWPSGTVTVEDTGPMYARVRKHVSEEDLRPGATVSGPAQMALADAAMYIATVVQIGDEPLAVTTSFNINFLRKPKLADLIAECRLLKLGKRLSVGEISIYSAAGNADEPCSHATCTYSIPPPGSAAKSQSSAG